MRVLTCLLLLTAPAFAEPSANLLVNPSFEQGASDAGVPIGWSRYAGGAEGLQLRLVDAADGGKAALQIHDEDPGKEIGVSQKVKAKGGLHYEAAVRVLAATVSDPGGAYLQMRFLPSNQLVQSPLYVLKESAYQSVSVQRKAPSDTTHIVIYLYTHRAPTPKVIVDSASLRSGTIPKGKDVAPTYDRLKNLHLTTLLASDGKPQVAIVAPTQYEAAAQRIAKAIERRAGVAPPITSDEATLTGLVIALGNRSTNRLIGRLYDRYYTLLDLRYPGAGGSVVRSLHSPNGDGHNVILVGSSDTPGVERAADVLVERINEAESPALGWIMDIHLGDGVEPPDHLRRVEIWEASAGYGSHGYFGWNTISKHMAMYYMTGREHHAREFLRLAFPDDKAKKQLTAGDGEMIENKDAPLSGPYHYNAHMMILYWDLIEESPVFTDDDRLRVINAFAQQFEHRKSENIWKQRTPRSNVGTRHGQWSAVSLYCLARYFQKSYPSELWEQCLLGAHMHFRSLHHYAWVIGEFDHHFWFSTGIAPIFTYLVLSGDREPVRNGVLATLLRGQEYLTNGRRDDSALRHASLGFLHKAAYLTQDGRWTHYRDLTDMNMHPLRLGQSFWPEAHLSPALPEDLVGQWGVHQLSKPAWQSRSNGLPLDESFEFASYRSTTGADGDYILLDGYNAAVRNPYHSFALLWLRLGGLMLLDGYRNQVMTRVDGMVAPRIAMNGALRYRDVIGDAVLAVGEVPNAAYCNWRRTLAVRRGRYALVVDNLTFRATGDPAEVQLLWEPHSKLAKQITAPGVVRLSGLNDTSVLPGAVRMRANDVKCSTDFAGSTGHIPLRFYPGFVLMRTPDPGHHLDMPFTLDAVVEGEVFVELLNYVDRGVVRIALDDQPPSEPIVHYSASVATNQVSLGRRRLTAGEHRVRITSVDRHPDSRGCYVGLSGMTIRPDATDNADWRQTYRITNADALPTTMTAGVVTMPWLGRVEVGQQRTFFSWITGEDDADAPVQCARIADNAAVLSLPALAVAGDYDANSGELVILAADHLTGRRMTRAGLEAPLLTADQPIDVDWDFDAGRLHVVAHEATELRLPGDHTVALEPGRYVVESKPPSAALREKLEALLRHARTLRRPLQQSEDQRFTDLPTLSKSFSASVDGAMADLTVIGQMIAVAEGKTVHLFDDQGCSVRTFDADGPIRMLRWWPQHELLLAGCADEQVIAFDLEGNRKWIFTSVMDPAVFRAAKQYWFKTAPGHEGIHGLHTGVFLDGKSQAFVGSACTLEIIDGDGQLLHRMPQFWGKVSHFAIVDGAGPRGSLNLLAGRKYNGTNRVGIVNNRTLDPKPRGFDTTPPGVDHVGGWSSMNRHHMFYTDLDGDGEKEVISEINGSWNRVTVWDRTGKALYDASFGPGRPIPTRNMRDLDVADLDGDGKQEIVTATSGGLLVMLDHQCRKRTVTKLPSPANVLACVQSQVIVGCDDGRVWLLDEQGAPTHAGRVEGRPTHVVAFGDGVLMATHRGEVAYFPRTGQ